MWKYCYLFDYFYDIQFFAKISLFFPTKWQKSPFLAIVDRYKILMIIIIITLLKNTTFVIKNKYLKLIYKSLKKASPNITMSHCQWQEQSPFHLWNCFFTVWKAAVICRHLWIKLTSVATFFLIVWCSDASFHSAHH